MGVYVWFVRRGLKREEREREVEKRREEVEMRKLGDGEVREVEGGSVVGSVDERSIDGIMRDVECGGKEEGKGEGRTFRWWKR